MNTKYIIGGFIAVVVIAGGYMAMRGNSSTDQRNTEQTQNRTSMRNSLRDFMTMPGESMKCTYSSTDATSQITTEGTTYVAQGKVRTDSTITNGTKVTTSSSIIDGDVMYAWGSDMPHGMKMSLRAMGSATADADRGADTMGIGDRAAGFDQQYDYSCEPWTADGSYFAKPAGVQFTDYTEMMQGMSGMMQDTRVNAQGGTDAGMMDGEMIMPGTPGAAQNAMMCAACEQAPDAESKAQCKAAMGCQ